MNPLEMTIGDRKIGKGHAPFVIAEMSANHLGSLETALEIVEAAAQAGADALKLQTYTADTLTIDCDRPEFQMKGGLWDGETLHSLYKKAYTPWEWHRELFEKAKSLGMLAFSSPFDSSAVEHLESLDVPAYKIASFEIVDHSLIAACAATGKPLIMSTGMASPEEVLEAVQVARANGAKDIAVLHCVSGYPTPVDQFNLRRMAKLQALVGTVVGISDHSPGATIPIAASALGASVIEKHLTLRRSDGGPDASFSLEPREFAQLVQGVHTAWAALGDGRPERASSEIVNVKYRRSLYVVKEIAKGEQFTEHNTRSIRPNLGLSPKYLEVVIGQIAGCDIRRGTPLSWDLVSQHALQKTG